MQVYKTESEQFTHETRKLISVLRKLPFPVKLKIPECMNRGKHTEIYDDSSFSCENHP